MLRHVILISTVVAGVACMEMRETVERVVMVRTTGSDLHPAASGYIYKKKNDGQESVVQMGESEVMEQLSKYYERPEDYGPASRGHRVPEKESEKAQANSEERIIPVKENAEEPVDGIADVDYKKIFDDYSTKYGDSSAYDEYLKNLKDLKSGLYSKYVADSAEDDNGYKNDYSYGKGNAGIYHDAKLQSYSVPGSYETVHDNAAHKEHYDRIPHRGSKENERNAAHDGKDCGPRFHRIYDNSDGKNNHEYFRGEYKSFSGGHKHREENGKKHDHDASQEPKHDSEQLGRSGNPSGPAAASEDRPASREGGPQGGHIESKSFGYKIEH